MAVGNGEIISAADFIASSAGAGDSGKVAKLNVSGKVDATMLDAPKSYVDNLDGANVKKTGAQSIDGVKTLTSLPLLPAASPTTDNQATRKKYVDDLVSAEASARSSADSGKVNNSGNETIVGVKTFSSIPVGPASDPTTDNQLGRKKYIADLDGANVKLTGNQTIGGVKTHTSIPVGPASDPTTDNQLVRKAYLDRNNRQNQASFSYDTTAWTYNPAYGTGIKFTSAYNSSDIFFGVQYNTSAGDWKITRFTKDSTTGAVAVSHTLTVTDYDNYAGRVIRIAVLGTYLYAVVATGSSTVKLLRFAAADLSGCAEMTISGTALVAGSVYYGMFSDGTYLYIGASTTDKTKYTISGTTATGSTAITSDSDYQWHNGTYAFAGKYNYGQAIYGGADYFLDIQGETTTKKTTAGTLTVINQCFIRKQFI